MKIRGDHNSQKADLVHLGERKIEGEKKGKWAVPRTRPGGKGVVHRTSKPYQSVTWVLFDREGKKNTREVYQKTFSIRGGKK